MQYIYIYIYIYLNLKSFSTGVSLKIRHKNQYTKTYVVLKKCTEVIKITFLNIDTNIYGRRNDHLRELTIGHKCVHQATKCLELNKNFNKSLYKTGGQTIMNHMRKIDKTFIF